MTTAPEPDHGSRRKVGVVVVPRYFDTTATELQRLAPTIDVLHTQMRLDDSFGFTFDEIIGAAEEISDCAAALAAAGAEVVLQLGTPFSTAHGWERGNALQAKITDRIGVPFVMMGLAVPAGVLALGARTAALATTYYPPDWTARYTAYASEAGIEIVGAQNFVDQGRFETHDAAWEASFAGFDSAFTMQSVLAVADAFPHAEAILVPGLPGQIVEAVAEAERVIDRPIVSYFATWWRCLAHLRLRPGMPAGRLLDSL